MVSLVGENEFALVGQGGPYFKLKTFRQVEKMWNGIPDKG